MKFNYLHTAIILLLLNGPLVQSQNAAVFHGCAADELMLNNTSLHKAQKELDDKAYTFFAGNNMPGPQRSIATIPVVVHIIHNGGPENISNTQVQAAIANINAKFAQSNNYQIQFCLAQRDPQGNATIGITRNTSSLTTETMEVDDIALKNINRWNSNCYLNIWIVKEILSQSSGNGVIGYAYFPSAHGLNMDGIVIEANYFGTSATDDAVGTHEIGHYLGLYHTFQNGCTNNNCLQDGDRVCDTPPDQTTFASCNPPANSCNTDANDLSSNNPFGSDVIDYSNDYMDYSSLSCYTQFTAGQYSRMQYYLTTTRNSLFSCLSCMTPCPAPLTANITSPSDTLKIITGTTSTFTGNATNSNNYKWYINPNTILGTGLTINFTFNSGGSFWMKFRVISNNPSQCTDAIDSVLVIVTEPVIVSCKGSLQLNNYNDAVHLPNNNQYYSSNGFTWECWFKLNTALNVNQQVRPLICAIDNVTYEDLFMGFGWFAVGYAAGDKLVFRVDAPTGSGGPNANGCSYAPPGGFLVGTWYHAAGVMNYVTHTGNLYLNGQLVDTKNITSAPFTRIINTSLSWDAIANPGYTFPALGGNMDEVRIWNRARTAAEIAASYNQCLAGNEQNLLLYYRCNQSAGSLAIDATANANNGTLLNTAAWSNQEPSYIGTSCSIACIEKCGNNIDDNGNGQIDEGCECIPPSITVNPATICRGDSITLTASGAIYYSWSPSSGLNNTTWATVKASPMVTTTYTITGRNNTGPELIFNGDFSQGDVGFTNDYGRGYMSPGYCEVGTSFWGTVLDGYGNPFLDHSSSNDNLMCNIDGASVPSIIWSQTINNLEPNKDHKFSFWGTENDINPPIYEVHFIGNVTGDVVVSYEVGKPLTSTLYQYVWDEYSSIAWNSGANTSVTIAIKSLETNGYGNDFAIDDISLRTDTCSSTVFAIVTVNNFNSSILDLGNDINLCSSGINTFDAGPGFKEYIWNDGSVDQHYTAYGPGKYWVTVKDSCGKIQSDTVSISTLPIPTLALDRDSTICLGDSLTFTFLTNGSFTNYQWTPITGLSCVNCPNPIATPLVTTKYYLVASTAQGCTNMDSISINVLNGGNISFNWDTICTGQNATLTATGGPTYLWSTSQTINPIIVSPLNTTTYSVVIGSGCTDTAMYVVMVNSSPLAIASGDTTIKYGQSTPLISSGGNMYQWIPSNGLSCSNCANSIAAPTSTTKYCVIVRTAETCADTACVTVTVDLKCDLESELFVPNVFSPNGDEQNDVLHVYGSGITELFWSIYNRWGEKVFETTDPAQGWDGKFKGKDLDPAVFVYYLDATCISGEIIKRKGNITIIK